MTQAYDPIPSRTLNAIFDAVKDYYRTFSLMGNTEAEWRMAGDEIAVVWKKLGKSDFAADLLFAVLDQLARERRQTDEEASA